MSDIKVIDYEGNELKVGDEVDTYFPMFHEGDDLPRSYYIGKIIEITDYDAEYDDDARRAVWSYPKVDVEFSDGEETYWTSPTQETRHVEYIEDVVFRCDDVLKIET